MDRLGLDAMDNRVINSVVEADVITDICSVIELLSNFLRNFR